MSTLVSMAAFALAASISPGPVNVVALGAGARFGLRASLRHVGGATIGFTLLLLLCGLGLQTALAQWPAALGVIRGGGVAFLLWMAWRLAGDEGRLATDEPVRAPSFRVGAVMQWLNPKAWLAAVAGMGAYAADGELAQVWLFTGIYFVVCYLSVGCWAWAGARLRGRLAAPARIRIFNRSMAGLLVGSALWLLVEG